MLLPGQFAVSCGYAVYMYEVKDGLIDCVHQHTLARKKPGLQVVVHRISKLDTTYDILEILESSETVFGKLGCKKWFGSPMLLAVFHYPHH